MAEPLFKTKTVKIDTLGEYLTSVRQQLNFDIKTVSTLTQIKPAYLENLEKGIYSVLPADVYIRGFLKNLAGFYHIKEKILIDQYEKERGFGVAPIGFKTDKFRLSLTPKRIVITASVLIGLLAVGYVGNQIRSVLAPPFLAIDEPASDLAISGNSIVVSGRGEIGALVSINNQPTFLDSNGRFSETLILSSGLNVIEIQERNKFGKVSTQTRQITAQTPTSPAVASGAVNLTINIGPGSAWVYLEADGIVVERGTMLAGSTKNISAKNEIIITSANAGSTQVIYNGKDLGKLGREGEVVRNVEFSSQ